MEIKADLLKRVKDILVPIPLEGQYVMVPFGHCLIVTESGERIGLETNNIWKVKHGTDS